MPTLLTAITKFNTGDVLATIIVFILMIVIPVALIAIIVMAYKKRSKRADEHANIDRQQTLLLQKQVNDLTDRLIKIENMLKEVD